MNIKLLKVCAAIMLIVGAGDVVCQGTNSMEVDGNASKKRKIEIDGWGDSVSANVSGQVQAVVKVRSGGKEKELKLFDVDGTESKEEDRTFDFEILVMGVGAAIKVEGGNGMQSVQNGIWNVFPEGYGTAGQNEKSSIQVQLVMYNASGERVELDNENSAKITGSNFKESWKIVLEPLPVKEDSVGKKYVGSLNVVVSANG
ncbi:MAG: hypothetical protein J6T91_01640 [Alphaproteobacteria bacterium]|nr:hypothetical protein [Alphaproteobacteria bacterium]